MRTNFGSGSEKSRCTSWSNDAVSETSPHQPSDASRRQPRWRHVASAMLLLASGGLVTGTLVRTTRYPNVNAPISIVEFATPAEQAAHLHDVAGTFATGNEPGDRLIVVGAHGRVTFQILGPLKGRLALVDTFRLSKRGDHANLVTPHSGVIAQDDIDHLTYCGDSYERTK